MSSKQTCQTNNINTKYVTYKILHVIFSDYHLCQGQRHQLAL